MLYQYRAQFTPTSIKVTSTIFEAIFVVKCIALGTKIMKNNSKYHTKFTVVKKTSICEQCSVYHPNIKLTHESNKERNSFLDLNVKLSGNKLSTNLYIKSADRHQYFTSHPEHTEKSVVYSQIVRLSRICSEEKDFEGLHTKTQRN